MLASHWADGGKGAEALANAVVELCEQPSTMTFAYEDDASLWEKVTAIATRIYGASEVTADAKIRGQIKELEAQGYGRFPVCVAKTQYSFSTDPSLARRTQRAQPQHPRGAARGGGGVHRHGLRRHHDHARPAEGALERAHRPR